MTSCHETSTWDREDTVAPLRFGRIVVGVDGSPNSVEALRVAAGLGARDRTRIEAVCVYRPYLHAAYPFATVLLPSYEAGEQSREIYASPGGVLDAAADAHAILENAAREAFGQRSQANLILRAIEGNAHDVLTRLAGPTDLLVVGARGHSGALGLLLGSTAQACARHAKSAVLIVPAAQQAKDTPTSDRVDQRAGVSAAGG